MEKPSMKKQMLRVADVAAKLNVSRGTVWNYSKAGLIKPIKLSSMVTVWSEEDIERFIASRIAVAGGEI